VDRHNDDIQIIPENEYCKSHYMNYFVGLIYAYKGLLMVSTSVIFVVCAKLQNSGKFNVLFSCSNFCESVYTYVM